MKNRFYNLLSLLLIFQMSFSQLSGQSQHSLVPVQSHDTSVLDWKLWGYRPNYWKMDFDFDKLSGNWAEYAEIDFKIPGSVQMALKNALVIEDWNIGLNSKDIEWIENRHWLITTRIPDTWIADKKKQVILECKGLDYKGLPPMQIGRHAQLQEWLQDLDDPKNEHRHVSHLYGLYPGSQISPYSTPALWQGKDACISCHLVRGKRTVQQLEWDD